MIKFPCFFLVAVDCILYFAVVIVQCGDRVACPVEVDCVLPSLNVSEAVTLTFTWRIIISDLLIQVSVTSYNNGWDVDLFMLLAVVWSAD